jgi:hypothetical protein
MSQQSPVTVVDGRPVLNNDQKAEPAPKGIPERAVPWLTGIVALALVANRAAPPHTVAAQIASAVVEVAVLFGIVSPGLTALGRKK